MGDLVVMDMARRQRDQRSDEMIWEAYRAAQIKAQTTLDIQDGIAAGKAWRNWLERFYAVQP